MLPIFPEVRGRCDFSSTNRPIARLAPFRLWAAASGFLVAINLQNDGFFSD